ncbi:hypothetical protein CDL12_03043 [Handroanthus impetiginosus]|uniref:Light-regulated protein n=1 Tax=Handroanthus impetiginosus TaxID=429701 RepID=A0A2G9I396_9LAMI|nr:hypothetical protein CDL12_03043 [Handroanthus impetiginosus]
MQSALTLSSPVPPCAPPKSLMSSPPKFFQSSRFTSIRSNALAVNYNSTTSVFPAEACETNGGDSCLAETFPEVKLKPEPKNKPKMATEPFEREYLDYTDPKTVLLADACDVLGGEFCEPPYQMGKC